MEAVVWTDLSIRWQAYDAIVIRSTWDYHLKSGLFLQWFGILEQSGAKIFNPISILRWNIDKHYLLDLKTKNIRIFLVFRSTSTTFSI